MEMTALTLATAQPLSFVAANAAAIAATMRVMAQQHQQQMHLFLPPNMSQQQVLAAAAATAALPAPAAAPPAPETNVEQSIAELHGQKWFQENGHAHHCINGLRMPQEQWRIKTIVGETCFSPSWSEAAASMLRLNMFMHMIGIDCLDSTIVSLTNIQLNEKGKRATTKQEILKFFGVSILATRFEFSSRCDLWLTHP
jgi:hypothetical protein